MNHGLLIVMLGMSSFLFAGDIRADASRGKAFAQANCGRCHAIGDGLSPLAQAPSFRVIARRYRPSDLEEALAEGIVTGHAAMPEFTLSIREIGDLTDYLKNLRR